MITILSHITNSAHKENANLIHWFISNPVALGGLIIIIVATTSIVIGHYKNKSEN
ncbi:MAG: hypothetical protein Q7T41_01405 [Candidatus Saccharibacteria bacterium]|nr:hypothetical protein [Candidatus Saccharibacteria bacterium]